MYHTAHTYCQTVAPAVHNHQTNGNRSRLKWEPGWEAEFHQKHILVVVCLEELPVSLSKVIMSLDISSKTALVTGATSGIGRYFELHLQDRAASSKLDVVYIVHTNKKLLGRCRETAFALAKLGATVVLGCRNVDAARQIAQEIRLKALLRALMPSMPTIFRGLGLECRQQVPGATIIIPGPLDLAQPASIHNFVNTYRQQGHQLHLLINNAGAAYRREWYTDEGVAGLTQVLHPCADSYTYFELSDVILIIAHAQNSCMQPAHLTQR